MLDVSVIFVNYKTKDLTINAINSVLEKTEGINYEIFVVDNASNDGSIDAIEQQFPDINIIRSPFNGGFGYANNLAIKQAQGKYILCLNTDTLLINNAIKIMFDFMEKDENKNVGACGGTLYDINDEQTFSAGYLPSLTSVALSSKLRFLFKEKYERLCGNKIDYNNIEYISGADIFLRKSVLDKIGIFDENIFMYFEETDLCYRIKQASYEIKFVKEAQIKHLENKSPKDNVEKTIWSKKSEFYYFRKYYPHKLYILKIINLIIFFIGGYILNKDKNKQILKFIWGYKI